MKLWTLVFPMLGCIATLVPGVGQASLIIDSDARYVQYTEYPWGGVGIDRDRIEHASLGGAFDASTYPAYPRTPYASQTTTAGPMELGGTMNVWGKLDEEPGYCQPYAGNYCPGDFVEYFGKSGFDIVFHVEERTPFILSREASGLYREEAYYEDRFWLTLSGGSFDIKANLNEFAPGGEPPDVWGVFEPGVSYALSVGYIADVHEDDLHASFAVNVVPEPTTATLLGVGLVLVAMRRRR